MFHTTLSRVNTLHKGKSIVIKSPGKSRTRGILLKTLVKGTGNRSLQIPGQKTG